MDAEQTKEELIRQTNHWLGKLKKLEIKGKTKKSKYLTDNIAAYTKDAEFFLKKEDYVRAFEAVVWAWAFATIGKETEELEF